MNAYLFTAGITQSQVRPTRLGTTQTADTFQTWDSCASLIVCSENPDEAQKRFETWLSGGSEDEHPVQIEIKKLVAAQFMEQLFTESGQEPIDWALISQRVELTLQASEDGDFEQGYWADVNQLVRPEKLSADIESLKSDLPEDIRSGLNWSADKQFFFIVSVLSPPTPPAGPAYEMESEVASSDDERDEPVPGIELEACVTALPEMRDKEVVALVQARNSAVAAWLRRKFAADSPFAANDIDLDSWCGVMSIGDGQSGPSEQGSAH